MCALTTFCEFKTLLKAMGYVQRRAEKEKILRSSLNDFTVFSKPRKKRYSLNLRVTFSTDLPYLRKKIYSYLELEFLTNFNRSQNHFLPQFY